MAVIVMVSEAIKNKLSSIVKNNNSKEKYPNLKYGLYHFLGWWYKNIVMNGKKNKFDKNKPYTYLPGIAVKNIV